MPEQETQAAFLRALIAYEDGEESLRLRQNLAKADRELNSIRQAMLVMVAIFVLSLAGLAYCVVLLPPTVYHPTRLVSTTFCILGLASLIAQLEFFGYLLWHRSAVNRLHKECRRRVLLLVDSQLRASLQRSPSAEICREPGSTLTSAPVQQTSSPSPEPAL